MVSYWDASALLPLVVREVRTSSYLRLARSEAVVTWWGSYLECVSAIQRRAREGLAAPPQTAESYRLLEELAGDWREVGESDQLRRAATRFLRTHKLRTNDALQLGAAMVAGHFEPREVRFRSDDRQLLRAAEKEGFALD
jgi:predicted nucleic acid-binding protein